MLDQRRPMVQALQRRVDVGDVLRRDDDVVGRDLGGEIADRVLERQVIGVRSTWTPSASSCVVGLLRHALLAEAGHDVDAIAAWVEGLGEEPHLRLLAAHDQPGEDPQDADRPGAPGRAINRRP